MKIFKYPLQLLGTQTIELPAIHRVLSVQVQNGAICLWIAVDDTCTTVTKEVFICGTGQEAPKGEYIGTVQQDEFVWHIFGGKYV